jgi:hypothetical protein
MNRKGLRIRLITIAVSTLVLSALACSFSTEVDLGGAQATAEAVGGTISAAATAIPTAMAAEPTRPPAPTEAPTEASGEGEAPPATEPPATEPAGSEPPPVEDPLEVAEIPELEVVTLDPSGDGLGNLGTFRQRMTVDFMAEDVDYSGTYRYEADVNTGDQAVHIVISAGGAAASQLPANSLEAIWIGTELWLKVGNRPWLPIPESVAAVEFDEQILAVADFLPYARQFERVGEETVNGIACAHYTYSADDLPTEYGTVSGGGDVYVALDGGYVVRYTLDGNGTFEGQFQGAGTISLVYDTYDVGAGIVIEPPRR